MLATRSAVALGALACPKKLTRIGACAPPARAPPRRAATGDAATAALVATLNSIATNHPCHEHLQFGDAREREAGGRGW